VASWPPDLTRHPLDSKPGFRPGALWEGSFRSPGKDLPLGIEVGRGRPCARAATPLAGWYFDLGRQMRAVRHGACSPPAWEGDPLSKGKERENATLADPIGGRSGRSSPRGGAYRGFARGSGEGDGPGVRHRAAW